MRTLDTYKAEDATAVVTNTYTTTSSCTMTAPVNGYYNICVFARCKKGGNACDFTVAAVSVSVSFIFASSSGALSSAAHRFGPPGLIILHGVN